MQEPGRYGNTLLAALDTPTGQALEKRLDRVVLPVGYKCVEAHRPVDHVYFPTDGIVSRMARVGASAAIDVGIFGRDGLSGSSLIFGIDRSPHEDIVQVAGTAMRAPAGVICELLGRDATFRGLLLRFAYCLSLQASYSTLASATGDVRARVSRLLAMCHDRLEGHEIALTHDFLATILGVRRSSVTSAIHHLEGDRLVKATRGRLHVKDRAALNLIAGPTYGHAEREYARLIDGSAALRGGKRQ